MKASAAVVRNIGGPFEIEDVEIEAPRGDEVLVRMVGVGVCHTDLVARDGFPVPMPIVLGHEGSGVVELVGPDVKGLAVGDHVVLSFNSCNNCGTCADDLPAYCQNFLAENFAGVRLADGSTSISKGEEVIHGNFFGQSSFATHAISHERNTVKVDKSLPLELLGPLGCGVQTGAGAAVISLGLKAGQSLAIFGGGAVGLSALLGARAIDAGTVIVVEPNEGRRKLALELGASHVIDPMNCDDVLEKIKKLGGGAGVNHALDTTGIPDVIAVAVETMTANGMLGLIGVPPPEAMIPANMMSMLVRGGIGVKFITEGDADPHIFIPQMIKWYQDGKFPFHRLVKTFPFAQINEAARSSESGEAIKPVLVF
ncbi:geraniol dehydrogenase [Sphingomonadales bacterium EhC05]|nr:geraniol dehydrogenase [Sphingomonadales bacterium EhC05]